MCTAVVFKTKDNYFGRNLDLEYSYNETVTITPRNFPFHFRNGENISFHHAIIGMAYVDNNYPLYYDAINEKGLGMAGLNFPGNAVYFKCNENKTNVATFEFIQYVLSKCSSVFEAKELIKNVNITDDSFSDSLPVATLHWIIADKNESITIESVKDGLRVYENNVGVLTNNPTFDMQMFNLNNYMHLSINEPVNTFLDGLTPYSRGMGAMGLPGDLSSQSRFVKAVFTKVKSVCNDGEDESVSQFFHILNSVEQQRGCVKLGDKYELTIYSSCCNTDKGIYYYKTYDNSQINAVDMYKENLDGKELISYPLLKKQNVLFQN
ncbi:MAG: choloylglycine hydrolase [Clostridia bacterium]